MAEATLSDILAELHLLRLELMGAIYNLYAGEFEKKKQPTKGHPSKGTVWATNGTKNIRVRESEIPPGYHRKFQGGRK